VKAGNLKDQNMKELNSEKVLEVDGGVVEGGCILLPPGFPTIWK
jgi:hypothetical protein